MQRRGISLHLQRTASGSTPHDRITVLQMCSSRSLAFDRPRRRAPTCPPILKSSDNLWSSTPPATHSSAASPSHNSLDRLDPNQPALPRRPNPHSARGTALRSLKRGLLPWRLSDAGRRTRGAVPSSGRHPKPFTLTDIAWRQAPALICRFGTEHVIRCQRTSNTFERKLTHWLDRDRVFDRREDAWTD